MRLFPFYARDSCFINHICYTYTLCWLLRKDFPDKKHSFDVWQGTKNLGKKLTKV